MGGFLCVRTGEGGTPRSAETAFRSAIDEFSSKGLSLKESIAKGPFTVFVFDKINFSGENLLHVGDNDFVIATGTLIYRNAMGRPALRALYDDFNDDVPDPRAFRGHFGVLIRKNGGFYAFNDDSGLYHIYTNEARSILSNSFVAVAKTLERRRISEQELYEYICYAAMYGDKTYLSGVNVLSSTQVHQLSPEQRTIEKRPLQSDLDGSLTFDDRVCAIADRLVDYFGILAGHFGDKISTALSGGYDSRLVVALLRRVEVQPHLYVYGKSESADVRISKAICRGENLQLDHDRAAVVHVAREGFSDVLRSQFHFYDGRGNAGVFGDGSDLESRRKRTEHATLQLNGGGGEIFRNYWKLRDTEFRVRDFIRARFDRLDFSIFTGRFDKRRFLDNLERKIRLALGTERSTLDRREIEAIYPHLRMKYWMGPNNTSNNFLSYALTPLAEPEFVSHSLGIPLGEKNHGRFAAAMIRRVDPSLASYPSAYGFNFRDPVPLRARLKNALETNCPVALRPMIYRRMEQRRTPSVPPYFLTKPYLETVFDRRPLAVSEFVEIDRIRDPGVLSRALTAELVIADRY